MKEWLAFLLPPATALVGMRISSLLLGKKLNEEFGFGLRFALGLCVGMFVFTQGVLFGAVIGKGLCAFLAWTILLWAVVEVDLLARKIFAGLKQFRFQIGHLWLLGLAPVVLLLWEYARLSVLEGVHEFDAAAFWLLKARILYFDHGKEFLKLLHTSNLAYTHMDYPWLAPGLYSLNYGAIGGVNEFVLKVWPFWMVVAVCGAILSIARFWHQPHPASILSIVLFCYIPATERYIGQEGATMPLMFGATTAAVFLVISLLRKSPYAMAAGILALACCAATKLEGVLYSILWAVPLSIYCWRLGWLKSPMIWKTILFAAFFFLPYAYVRLQKPVLYPEAYWAHDAAATPAKVIRRYPQTLFLGIGRRFFNNTFFHWDSPDKDHLHYIGTWQGRATFAGPDFSVLPWIFLAVLALTFWKKPQHRLTLSALLAVIVGQVLALSFVITSLRPKQDDLNEVIGFTGEIVGRYFYPFFVACFLGVMAIWMLDYTSEPTAVQDSAQPSDQPIKPETGVDDQSRANSA
jgi:hypothetical protein